MTCWKTLSLSKQYGVHRITIVSLFTMLLAFILFFLPLNVFYSNTQLHEDGLLLFTTSLLLIFPCHKLLHALPLFLSGKKLTMKIDRESFILPLISVRPNRSSSKYLMIIVLLTPFILITGIMFSACVLFPEYIHYFTIIAAINLGFCVSDFIFIKQLIKAPKSCIIEENGDGYDILINS
jgi:hypothetical protein